MSTNLSCSKLLCKSRRGVWVEGVLFCTVCINYSGRRRATTSSIYYSLRTYMLTINIGRRTSHTLRLRDRASRGHALDQSQSSIFQTNRGTHYCLMAPTSQLTILFIYSMRILHSQPCLKVFCVSPHQSVTLVC